ncbi:MAG: hypothetical protein K8S22_14195 [Betaproteobacteria bacterium]|nr:hypothetical protein [Betaproteobacteria bacterium]
MSRIPDDIDWTLTTWEGVRREQLRRAAAFTLRERMQSLEDMAEVAERFRQMREAAKSGATGAGTPEGAARQPPAAYEPDGE